MPVEAQRAELACPTQDILRFEDNFGVSPTLSAWAPGRVNLIGDHIDYSGLSVLPMALQRGIRLLGRPRVDGRVQVLNHDSRFPPFVFSIGSEIPPSEPGHWGNYVKGAAQHLVGLEDGLLGMDLLVTSDIPVASGLSSSSALVVATALALLAGSGREMDALALAREMAEAERYCGTAGGGMDQAICLMGQEGCATLVDFRPLRVTHLPLPPTWVFVVAQSLVPAQKSGAAQAAYNERAHTCAVAFEVVAPELSAGEGSGLADWSQMLRDHTESRIVEAASQTLPSATLSRVRHLVSESGRVERAQAALRDRDIRAFGALMKASHESLRNDFEVSCPELDELVALMQESGAVGARLTGAGFGGCVLGVCRAGEEVALFKALDERFYRTRGLAGSQAHRFVAVPSRGAQVSRV
jgi:galactokinase